MKRRDNTLAMYIVGFVLSLALTTAAYIVVTQKLLNDSELITALITLAIAQVLVQLFFFLHLGRETKPRWRLVVFLFMLLVLGIVVIGSLWIMQNLDYHMTPQESDTYMLEHKDRGF